MVRLGWILALTACNGGDDAGNDPDDDAGEDDTTPDPPEEFTLFTVDVHPPDSTRVYLVQQLDVTTSEPSTLTARITDASGTTRTITWTDVSDVHEVPLLGLHALEEYTVEVSVEGPEGEVLTADPVTFTNGPLPDVFPTLELYARDETRLEPGYILAAPWSTGLGRVVFVLDDEARPVWVYVPTADWKAAQLTARGVVGLQANTVPEISWLGKVVHRFASEPEGNDIPLAFDGLHHEALPLPDGGLYLLTAEPYDLTDYPLDYTLTLFGDATISNHLAMRVAADGTTTETWSLVDIVDPRRIGYDSADFISGTTHYDWAHANAVVVNEADDSILISLRNQDAIVKLARATGEIVWIFGQPSGWSEAFQPYLLTPVGDEFQWQGHQHAPALGPDGALLMFDNGNDGRNNPYSTENGGPVYSRVVQFTIDEVARTARQDWEWQSTTTGTLFSPALGNADPLPVTGNVFATFSFLYNEDGVDNEAMGRGAVSSRLIQFSPEDAATTFDLSIHGPLDTQPSGWLADRATWLPTLYGDAATVE